MIRENKSKINKILSFVVIAAGILVIIGWVYNIPVLKSISPEWISMKFVTAVGFVLSGVILYFVLRALEGEFDWAQVMLSIASFILILLMGSLFFSAIFKINMGVENLFIKDTTVNAKTVVPGRPSIPAMISFLLIAFAGISTTLHSRNLRSKLRLAGIVIGSVGMVAVAGYVIDKPVLYYFLEGVNSAIALNTAALFMVLGIGFICL